MRRPFFYATKNTWYVWDGDSKVSLGVRGEENKTEAMEAWHRIMANGKAVPEARADSPTVAEVIDAFLADAKERVSRGTLRNYTAFLTPFKERHGKAKADRLTPPQAETYSRKPTWNGTHRGDFLTTLASAFRLAEQTGLLASNPLRHLRKPCRSVRTALPLISADEHARLLKAATPAFRPFLEVLHMTGARPSEVATITAENFDAEAAVVRLSEHKTAHKGKERILFLLPKAVAILRKQAKRYGSGYLFRNRHGTKFTKNAIGLVMRRLRKRAGIGHATAYAYRHSFATDALSNGVPDAQVAELLGHSGTAMLHKHYAHLGAKARVLREALGRVR
jgi:integrase